jgi:hypothetical protein
MGRFEAASQALAVLLPRIGAGWPGSKWEWDGRLECALSVVATGNEAQARAALSAQLPVIWTGDTLGQAPVLIKQICGRTGGLLARQLAFVVELPEGVLAYALWWPWGSGANVSVRIGVSHESVMPGVRAAFGV